MIRFTIYGEPKPQGSKCSQVIYGKGGKPVIKNGRVLTVVRNVDKKLDIWRNQIAAAAAMEYGGELLGGPIGLRIEFTKPRPRSHFGTGRNSGKLKTSAPHYPTTRPDTLKLARAVEDSLSRIIWRDDSQVVRHDLAKVYGKRFETLVEIEELE